jgi:hypothetical protein
MLLEGELFGEGGHFCIWTPLKPSASLPSCQQGPKVLKTP